MIKQKYVFLNCNGQIIPQSLGNSESGDAIVAMLDQKAVMIPVTCFAESSSQAYDIYKNKVSDNIDTLMAIATKESLHVR